MTNRTEPSRKPKAPPFRFVGGASETSALSQRRDVTFDVVTSEFAARPPRVDLNVAAMSPRPGQALTAAPSRSIHGAAGADPTGVPVFETPRGTLRFWRGDGEQ
jgi:hypothetical protein